MTGRGNGRDRRVRAVAAVLRRRDLCQERRLTWGSADMVGMVVGDFLVTMRRLDPRLAEQGIDRMTSVIIRAAIRLDTASISAMDGE